MTVSYDIITIFKMIKHVYNLACHTSGVTPVTLQYVTPVTIQHVTAVTLQYVIPVT